MEGYSSGRELPHPMTVADLHKADLSCETSRSTSIKSTANARMILQPIVTRAQKREYAKASSPTKDEKNQIITPGNIFAVQYYNAVAERLARSPPTKANRVQIPGRIDEFSRVGIVPGDAVGRRVFSRISRLPCPFIPAVLHIRLNHTHQLSRPSLTCSRRPLSIICFPLHAQHCRVDRSDVSGWSEEICAALNIEVSRANEGEVWRRNAMTGELGIPEKTRRPPASSGTIPTCENKQRSPPRIVPGSPSWETKASGGRLTHAVNLYDLKSQNVKLIRPGVRTRKPLVRARQESPPPQLPLPLTSLQLQFLRIFSAYPCNLARQNGAENNKGRKRSDKRRMTPRSSATLLEEMEHAYCALLAVERCREVGCWERGGTNGEYPNTTTATTTIATRTNVRIVAGTRHRIVEF
ncbi:hypothetical protein PR048_027481 [Dryococelus australis]|uniref:Uncharacterized protein n=1 Tax=Dryococelus australis TaxID=614101 RepID=A0ABQ9GFK2_9NEOP|nr:hypothetical protein PR048_027481 [Dryococelus australis]